MKTRDSLYVQRHELVIQLQGISPKLALYETIKKQIAAIDAALEKTHEAHG